MVIGAGIVGNVVSRVIISGTVMLGGCHVGGCCVEIHSGGSCGAGGVVFVSAMRRNIASWAVVSRDVVAG